jgi:hypothetical protein
MDVESQSVYALEVLPAHMLTKASDPVIDVQFHGFSLRLEYSLH